MAPSQPRSKTLNAQLAWTVWTIALCASALTVCLHLLVGCSPAEQQKAATATDLAGYSLALDDCRAKGKDAGSYAVYETCAESADKKYGRKP